MKRLLVSAVCEKPCPACIGCRPDAPVVDLEAALQGATDADDIVLGGGDATRWTGLEEFLRRRPPETRVWVEAPAASFTPERTERLVAAGLHGALVQIEAVGEKWTRALGVADGESTLRAVEAAGLRTAARICVRPKTFRMVAPLAAQLAPRPVWLEIARRDWGGQLVAMHPAQVEGTLLASSNIRFSGHRLNDRGYLPPCALLRAWTRRPEAWRSVLRSEDGPKNRVLPECTDCSLARRCQWTDVEALGSHPEVRPTEGLPPWERGRAETGPIPDRIVQRRSPPEIVCVTPWTTIEVVDVSGKAHQCCSMWTVGHRGDLVGSSLTEIWNGDGFRSARRTMAGRDRGELCRPICPRLQDGQYAERHLRVVDGSQTFVKNQLLLAEDIAERREEVRGRPLYLAICPTTYCNYDCIMCLHGRTPRRDLPESIWDELPKLFPTLRTLTLLGGEPLASQRVMSLLRDFDRDAAPDMTIDFVTNGSLLTAGALKHLDKCSFGDVTVSLNAGTPETYERVQRGIALDSVLENLDALMDYRSRHARWFGISLSFVVQPANSSDLVAFGRLAHERNARVRLLPLNAHGPDGLDFYDDEDVVSRVLADADEFADFARQLRPEWLGEIRATRDAIQREAESRRGGAPYRPSYRLPVVG